MNGSDKTTSLEEGGQGSYRSRHGLDATLGSLSVDPQTKLGRTRNCWEPTSALFRLPPELRNAIYTYVVYNKYGLPQFEWDGEHNCPELDFSHTKSHAPSNRLLGTCQSIYAESKGIVVKAQREYWSDTTFTLQLDRWPPLSSFGHLERLNDRQVGHMARVNIHTDVPMPFTVHLRSGSEAASSVSGPACTHRSWLSSAVGLHGTRGGR